MEERADSSQSLIFGVWNMIFFFLIAAVVRTSWTLPVFTLAFRQKFTLFVTDQPGENTTFQNVLLPNS